MGTYVTVRVENEGTVSRCGWKYGLFDEMLKKLARAVKVPDLASFYCGGGGHGEVYRMIAPLRNDVMEKEYQGEISGAEADRRIEALEPWMNWLGRWFKPQEGLKTVKAIITYLEKNGREFETRNKLPQGWARTAILDLGRLEEVLEDVRKRKKRFRIEYG